MEKFSRDLEVVIKTIYPGRNKGGAKSKKDVEDIVKMEIEYVIRMNPAYQFLKVEWYRNKELLTHNARLFFGKKHQPQTA